VVQTTVGVGAQRLWQNFGSRNVHNLILGAQHVVTGVIQGAGLQYFTIFTQGAGWAQYTGAAHPHFFL